MFEIKQFKTPEMGAMHIWDYFRKFTWTAFDSLSMFHITHSQDQDNFVVEEVNFDNLYEQIAEFLRDLDAQEGVYRDNEEGMDFDETPEGQDQVYRELGKKRPEVGLAGEGFLMFKNTLASAKGEYPFIITKPSLWLLCGDEMLKSLKINNSLQDYTTKVIPAIYIEFGDR